MISLLHFMVFSSTLLQKQCTEIALLMYYFVFLCCQMQPPHLCAGFVVCSCFLSAMSSDPLKKRKTKVIRSDGSTPETKRARGEGDQVSAHLLPLVNIPICTCYPAKVFK